MNPWELFGLDAETDTRSVKRRYAQLLKQYRPDEDAEAFQRLREAYEYALAWVEREVREPEPDAELSVEAAPWHQPLAPALFDSGQPTYAPLTYTQQPSRDEHAWVRALPDTCESLDDALDQARQAQQEPVLQLELLRRCQEPGEQAIEALRWAMDRLNWLSPWQADYLPLASMNGLAERLLNAELWMWWSQLEAGEEHAVLNAVALLLAEPWMQPFDRRNQVQQGLLELLENGEGWSLKFFDGLCQLFGWDEARGQIPCDGERWERLCSHSEGLALRADLHRWLDEERPESAQARAAWLLFKPMGDGQRRQWVDGFDDADWRACDALALRVEQDAALDQLGFSYLQQWRAWRPGSGWNQLYPLLWGCLCLVLLLLNNAAPIEGPADLAITLVVVMVIATALLMVFRIFIKGWNRFARWRVLFDVGISRQLLPASWVRGGSGLLLLRHIVPSAFFAALTFGWASGLVLSSALALLTFILCVRFLYVASRGGAPAAWLILAWRQLVPLGKHLLIWVVILVLVAVLSRMFMGPKAPDLDFSAPRPADRPADSLTVCQRPSDANREACADAMRMVQEAMQRVEQAHAQKQVP